MEINYYKQYEPIFETYTIKEELGEGGFGKVFEIERKEFGKTYKSALKAITVPKDKNELDILEMKGIDPSAYYRNIMEKIRLEVELMADLKGHSNLVSYENHKFIQHPDGVGWDILIQMELLIPLIKYLKNNKMTSKDVVKLGIDICKGLEICHGKQIIHRDIKLENIFLSHNGDFKLGDFGIAKLTEGTQTGTKAGTPSYMAPEVFNNESYGATVDIYSLGLVMYTILNDYKLPLEENTGDFSEDRLRAVSKRMCGMPFGAPKYCDARLAAIVMKACAFNPKERFHTAEEMRRALEDYVLNINKAGVPEEKTTVEEKENTGRTPVTKTPPKKTNKTQTVNSPKNKKKVIAAIAIAVAVLLMVGISSAYLLTAGGDEDQSSDVTSEAIGTEQIDTEAESGDDSYKEEEDGEEASAEIMEVSTDGVVILNSDYDMDSMNLGTHEVDVIMNVRNNSGSYITAMDFTVDDVDGNYIGYDKYMRVYGYVDNGSTGIMVAKVHMKKNYTFYDIDRQSYKIKTVYCNTAAEGYKVPKGTLDHHHEGRDTYDVTITNKNDVPVNSTSRIVTVYMMGSRVRDCDATGTISRDIKPGETYRQKDAFSDPGLWTGNNGGLEAYEVQAIDIDYLAGK